MRFSFFTLSIRLATLWAIAQTCAMAHRAAKRMERVNEVQWIGLHQWFPTFLRSRPPNTGFHAMATPTPKLISFLPTLLLQNMQFQMGSGDPPRNSHSTPKGVATHRLGTAVLMESFEFTEGFNPGVGNLLSWKSQKSQFYTIFQFLKSHLHFFKYRCYIYICAWN